jgi:hypothetical protein
MTFWEGSMKLSEIDAMYKAVIYIMEHYPKGHIYYGNELHDDVTAIYPKARYMYVDTILRAKRKYCSHLYICINNNRSRYKRI